MRELWHKDISSFNGELVHFWKVKMLPKRPIAAKGIPTVVGGHGDAAARRAGKLGDGFFPAIFPNSELWARLRELIATMRAAAVEAGRDADTIEITSGGTRSADGVQRFRDLGVSRMVIRARSRDPKELPDELMRFGDEVITKT
jgi:alkanesulfonate monooxygenase SsuD/methylene tetrahydromethanopterin reductase-like flavin-dependent oxidoreductase (luciferase family)